MSVDPNLCSIVNEGVFKRFDEDEDILHVVSRERFLLVETKRRFYCFSFHQQIWETISLPEHVKTPITSCFDAMDRGGKLGNILIRGDTDGLLWTKIDLFKKGNGWKHSRIHHSEVTVVKLFTISDSLYVSSGSEKGSIGIAQVGKTGSLENLSYLNDHRDVVSCLCQMGKYLVSGGGSSLRKKNADFTLRLWDLNTKQLVHCYNVKRDTHKSDVNVITPLEMTADGHFSFLSCSDDNIIAQWTTSHNTVIRKFSNLHHDNWITALLTFSIRSGHRCRTPSLSSPTPPNEQLLFLSSSNDRDLILLDLHAISHSYSFPDSSNNHIIQRLNLEDFSTIENISGIAPLNADNHSDSSLSLICWGDSPILNLFKISSSLPIPPSCPLTPVPVHISLGPILQKSCHFNIISHLDTFSLPLTNPFRRTLSAKIAPMALSNNDDTLYIGHGLQLLVITLSPISYRSYTFPPLSTLFPMEYDKKNDMNTQIEALEVVVSSDGCKYVLCALQYCRSKLFLFSLERGRVVRVYEKVGTENSTTFDYETDVDCTDIASLGEGSNRVALCGLGRKVMIYDWEKGESVRVWKEHEDWQYCVQVLGEEEGKKRIVSAGSDMHEGGMYSFGVFDVEKGDCVGFVEHFPPFEEVKEMGSYFRGMGEMKRVEEYVYGRGWNNVYLMRVGEEGESIEKGRKYDIALCSDTGIEIISVLPVCHNSECKKDVFGFLVCDRDNGVKYMEVEESEEKKKKQYQRERFVHVPWKGEEEERRRVEREYAEHGLFRWNLGKKTKGQYDCGLKRMCWIGVDDSCQKKGKREKKNGGKFLMLIGEEWKKNEGTRLVLAFFKTELRVEQFLGKGKVKCSQHQQDMDTRIEFLRTYQDKNVKRMQILMDKRSIVLHSVLL